MATPMPATFAPATFAPVVLEGATVRLEPLRADHAAALWAAVGRDDIFAWFTHPVRSEGAMAAWVAEAVRLAASGAALPFVTIERSTGRPVGSSRFLNIDRANRHAEIGATFVGRRWQRSAVNTEAKLLMLTHAFETEGCIRVEFKTDSLNARSRAALARLGAVEEGIFRNHMICADGRIRHSVYFSITDGEWPAAKRRLQEKLAARATEPAR